MPGHERVSCMILEKLFMVASRMEDGQGGTAEEGLAVGFRLAKPTLSEGRLKVFGDVGVLASDGPNLVWSDVSGAPFSLGTWYGLGVDFVENRPTAATENRPIGHSPKNLGHAGHLRPPGAHLVAGIVEGKLLKRHPKLLVRHHTPYN
jgi:hypothetical protein